MVTASGPAGRKTSANPHASAAAPITTASVSRTAERPGRIRERLPARAGYIFGAGHFDSNSVAHTVGQTLAPSLIVPIAAAAEAPKFLRTAPPVATRITTAQETATEQVAAADVIRRMSELERSLALPQLVARLAGARDARRDAVIARAKDLMDRELLAMADDITRHPETGWKEERSVKILTDYLTAHGFDVEPGVAGLKTAFVARYRKGTPGPNLGVIVEYDALRGTSRDFHGDQHSAQGPVGLAAAVAVTEFLTSSKTPGTVTVYGTPAEELASPAAKTVMYNAGVFKGADVLIRSHSSTATQAPGAGFGSCCMNINVVHYTFSGAPAHQLQAWDGRDALMGVIELFNHIDGLRKTLRPETKVQGIITEGGKAPNVVPDRAVAEFWIRYPDPVYLAQV